MVGSVKLIVERDSNGFVTDVKFPEEFFEVSDEELAFLDEEDSLSHAANLKSLKLIVERDSDGFVTDVKFPEEFFEVSDEELAFLDEEDNPEEELMHYGVPGMKWGIRKAVSDNLSVKRKRVGAYFNRRTISDQELSSTIKRLEMEKKLKTLVMEDVTPGRYAMNNLLSKYGGMAAGAASGAIGAALVKEVLKQKGIGG